MKKRLLILGLIVALFLATVSIASAGAPTVTKVASPHDISLYSTGAAGELSTVTITVTGSGGLSTPKPIDVIFSIDSTGSMASNDPYDLRKTASIAFVSKMATDAPNSAGGVVSWDTGIDFIYPSSGLSTNFPELKTEIGLVNALGSTDGNLGMNKALDMAATVPARDSAKIIIFLTDGQFNYNGDAFTTYTLDRAKASGYTVYTIGLGHNVNEVTLKAMASATGGTYTNAVDADALIPIFDAIYSTINAAPKNVNVIEKTQPYMVGEGSFNPAAIETDPTFTWNNIALSVGNKDAYLEDGEVWTATFTVGTDQTGDGQPIQVLPGAKVVYDFDTGGTGLEVSIPQDIVNVPTCIPTTEICNGLDDDCDGVVDNGIASTLTTCGVGECASTGTLACVDGNMVDSCKKGVPTAEICDNKDNDCDETVDEALTRGTSCGTGDCGSTGTETCSAGTWGGNTCNPSSTNTNDCGKIGECVSGVCVEGTQAGFLLPTQTTCQMYANGYRQTYIPNQFNYILKGTKIGSISPGVIFYYNTITAPSPAFTLTVPQKNTGTGGNWNPMLVQQENKKMQAYLYDKDCNIVTTVKTAQNNPYTVTFDVKGVTTGNTYYIGIKYAPANLVGITPTGVTRTYTWSTVIGNNHLANSDVSIPVIKK